MDKTHVLVKPVPSSWSVALDGWEIYLRAGGRSERTVETRVRHVRQAARALQVPPHEVTGGALIDWCGAQEWAAETRHAYYESVTLFFRWLCRAGPSPADVLPVVRRRPSAPRPVPLQVLEEGLAGASPRTRLILSLAACAGLRAREVAAVHRRDLVQDDGGFTLVVRGKGDRVRVVPLQDWLARAVASACARGGGFAFPGRIDGHLSAAHVSKVGARALPGEWTLHTLRHRFATAAYSAERDLLAVQRLLGHASVATTQQYAAPPEDALRRAVEAADIRKYLQ